MGCTPPGSPPHAPAWLGLQPMDTMAPIHVDPADTVLNPEPPEEPVGRKAAPHGTNLQALDGLVIDVVGYPEPPRLIVDPNLGLINKGLPCPRVEEILKGTSQILNPEPNRRPTEPERPKPS